MAVSVQKGGFGFASTRAQIHEAHHLRKPGFDLQDIADLIKNASHSFPTPALLLALEHTIEASV